MLAICCHKRLRLGQSARMCKVGVRSLLGYGLARQSGQTEATLTLAMTVYNLLGIYYIPGPILSHVHSFNLSTLFSNK